MEIHEINISLKMSTSQLTTVLTGLEVAQSQPMLAGLFSGAMGELVASLMNQLCEYADTNLSESEQKKLSKAIAISNAAFANVQPDLVKMQFDSDYKNEIIGNLKEQASSFQNIVGNKILIKLGKENPVLLGDKYEIAHVEVIEILNEKTEDNLLKFKGILLTQPYLHKSLNIDDEVIFHQDDIYY